MREVIVAVDVDGVLRIPWDPKVAARWPDVFGAEVRMRRDAYPMGHHVPPVWDEEGCSREVDGFSGVGAAWLRDLVTRPGVSVWWATTWREHANTYFADLLGIPNLPVATVGIGRRSESAPEWKARQLADRFPGHPLLWVDDNPTWPLNLLEICRRPIDRALTHSHIVANPLVGVTSDDVCEMDEWIALASTADGQRTLRATRRRELARRRALDRRLHQRLGRGHPER